MKLIAHSRGCVRRAKSVRMVSHVNETVEQVAPFAGLVLTLDGAASTGAVVVSSHYGLGDYVRFDRFERWGTLLTAQNPYLVISSGRVRDGVTLAYSPAVKLSPGATFVVDTALLGVHALTGRLLSPPADPIDAGEHSAMTAAVRASLVVAQDPDVTVKVNIGWTENDYQIDIGTAAGRAEYKRIIDRASQFGVTSLLFAPQNSDVSCRANNTDAWGWEQLLFFGMGQRLRMGLWKPGDALPASLVEMLHYFKEKKVKPVAYVYPILAFLAGTYPNGTSPSWIVPGTYDLAHAAAKRPPLHLGHPPAGNGPLRASLADIRFQQWLPDTMVAFAAATGAGGFSFDYTYFEQNLPVASQYAQWQGWRTILHRLHTAKGGKACGEVACVVDNRQQNHAWGPWMWAQGGSYAEPLMSDEQALRTGPRPSPSRGRDAAVAARARASDLGAPALRAAGLVDVLRARPAHRPPLCQQAALRRLELPRQGVLPERGAAGLRLSPDRPRRAAGAEEDLRRRPLLERLAREGLRPDGIPLQPALIRWHRWAQLGPLPPPCSFKGRV